MLELFSILMVGFVLGMRHATDADHVIAVSTIVSRHKDLLSASLIGVAWGIGHSLTLLLVGGAIVLFGLVIPARLGLSLEFAVGVMLVILGVWTVRGALQRSKAGQMRYRAAGHAHTHAHGDYAHFHSHGHGLHAHGHAEQANPQARLDLRFGRIASYRYLRPLVVGIVHGLAGSAAVALLVLPLVRDPWWGMAYLGCFGLGTIAGMLMITTAIAAPFVAASRRHPNFNNRLRLAAGALSVGFGVYVMVQIGFGSELFVARPLWALN